MNHSVNSQETGCLRGNLQKDRDPQVENHCPSISHWVGLGRGAWNLPFWGAPGGADTWPLEAAPTWSKNRFFTTYETPQNGKLGQNGRLRGLRNEDNYKWAANVRSQELRSGRKGNRELSCGGSGLNSWLSTVAFSVWEHRWANTTQCPMGDTQGSPNHSALFLLPWLTLECPRASQLNVF